MADDKRYLGQRVYQQNNKKEFYGWVGSVCFVNDDKATVIFDGKEARARKIQTYQHSDLRPVVKSGS